MIVEFNAPDEEYGQVFDPPIPAKDVLPEWYKNQNAYIGGEKVPNEKGMFDSTIKHCMPVFDALTAGYILTLPTDLHVIANPDGTVNTSWPVLNRTIIESHSPEQVSHFHFDKDLWYEVPFKLLNGWQVKTPPGYSTLFTMPFFREEDRFFVFSGIVDTDTYPNSVNFPFLIKRNFSGTIDNGTPFVQIIPFKRDEWEHSVGLIPQEDNYSWLRATRQSSFRYKTLYRSAKSWN
jgi:hypothetical protein